MSSLLLGSTIETIVANGGAHAKEFECLRGRLQFAESQVFGRGAAQRMRVVSKAMKLSGFVVLDDSLTEALLFLKDRVLHGGVRLLKACDPLPTTSSLTPLTKLRNLQV